MVMRSALVIIHGSPASGKTSLGLALAADLGIPCFAKDQVKEALFDALGVGNREWSARLSRASFAVLLRIGAAQLNAGRPCLLEGNWRAEHVPALQALARGTDQPLAQVCCFADPAEIDRRFRARVRHPGHLDGLLSSEVLPKLPLEPRLLDLPGPAWVYRADMGGGYSQLRRDLEFWFEGRQFGTKSSI
jgi:predicted kinase